MKKKMVIRVLQEKGERFFGRHLIERINDIGRITIYHCALDSERKVLFFFKIDEEERKVIFYCDSNFRRDVRKKIASGQYLFDNARRVMYGNFRYLDKLAEVEYEISDFLY